MRWHLETQKNITTRGKDDTWLNLILKTLKTCNNIYGELGAREGLKFMKHETAIPLFKYVFLKHNFPHQDPTIVFSLPRKFRDFFVVVVVTRIGHSLFEFFGYFFFGGGSRSKRHTKNRTSHRRDSIMGSFFVFYPHGQNKKMFVITINRSPGHKGRRVFFFLVMTQICFVCFFSCFYEVYFCLKKNCGVVLFRWIVHCSRTRTGYCITFGITLD